VHNLAKVPTYYSVFSTDPSTVHTTTPFTTATNALQPRHFIGPVSVTSRLPGLCRHCASESLGHHLVMNSIIAGQHFAPHLLANNRLSPSRTCRQTPFARNNPDNNPSTVLSPPNNMPNRKRKADDDGDNDDRMSASPSGSPAVSSRTLSRPSTKRVRTNVAGRFVSLPRLLETLDADELRNLLQSIVHRHPDIGNEIVTTAPRPSVSSALTVLTKYESTFQGAFPFGGRPSSDYSYNRVRQHLIHLLDALRDFTPHFLPPNESQPATSLDFLDGATQIIHRLPNWDAAQNNLLKQEAYEEMAKAWAAVFHEAAKRAGGIQIQCGGWDQKIAKHNEISGGKMQEAVEELRRGLGWMGNDGGNPGTGGSADTMSVRQQLLNGTYGMGPPVPVGRW